MSVFDLATSLQRARQRFGEGTASRQPRSDRGNRRLPPPLVRAMQAALTGHDRPPIRRVLEQLDSFCRVHGYRRPSRATVYQVMAALPPPMFRIEELPAAARETLYNLPATGAVPGHQLAFHCFNYGSLAAMSLAAGLPWVALYQAARMRGWRPGSRGLLEAVLRARGITAP